MAVQTLSMPSPAPDPWRDFSEDEQRILRNLLRRMKEYQGKHFDVMMRKDGQIEIAEFDRRIIVGRGVN